MSIQNPIVDVLINNVPIENISVATNSFRGARARSWARAVFLRLRLPLLLLLLAVGASLIFSPAAARGQAATTPEGAPSVVQTDVKLVIGGETIKNNSTGTLSVVGNSLQFVTCLLYTSRCV